MAGCLHVVATPIGNLEDITLRALRILREVELIAAEDTRRTARLLQHYSISTRTTSLHEHNERQKIPSLVDRLEAGGRIALVSDAGTPVVSDPGARLVAAAQALGIRVEAVPGPSAVLAALVSSGLTAVPFVFLGFPPTRSKDRKQWFDAVASERRTVVLFEAPHRILATLKILGTLLGERQICVCRELTKIHEELVNGPINVILSRIGQPRGEYTLVIGPASGTPEPIGGPPTDAALADEFGQITEMGGIGRREAIRRLAETYKLRQRDVYQALERAKNSVK
jgi:16S rRNA (cytidine1402-2'-O)-methyltransferase